jgi:hypothetical protein
MAQRVFVPPTSATSHPIHRSIHGGPPRADDAQKKPPLGKGRWGWARMMCRLSIIFIVFLLLEVLAGSF